MKKTAFYLLVFSLFGFQSFSQNKLFSKNNIIYTGSFGGHVIVSDTGDVLFNLNQKAGFMLNDKVMLGAGFGFDESGGYDASLFSRYFISNKNGFASFVQASCSYFRRQATETKIKGFNVTLSPGINYMLTDGFGIEASLGLLSYSTAKSDVSNSKSVNDLQLSLDLKKIGFGFLFKF